MPRHFAPLGWLALLVAGCHSVSVEPPARAVDAAPGRARTTLTYLGVAGWQLEHEGHVLLVDPYVSRRDVEDWKLPIAPDDAAIARYTPARADAVLVSHSHFDHLLDVPSIARRSGASVVGSESTLNVARASGVAKAQLVPAHPGETVSFGPFSVRVIKAEHSLTGQAFGTIPREVHLPLRADDYVVAETYQYLVTIDGRSVLFISTANFLEPELTGLRPDVAVIAVGLRSKIPDYSCRLMRALGRPPLVFANHFDAFMQPLGPHQMDIDAEDRQSLARFADEIHACAPDTRVVVPEQLGGVGI
jgi:L-ascorbate metabolism protein UlaG (beta-lactamase superfamily)